MKLLTLILIVKALLLAILVTLVFGCATGSYHEPISYDQRQRNTETLNQFNNYMYQSTQYQRQQQQRETTCRTIVDGYGNMRTICN